MQELPRLIKCFILFLNDALIKFNCISIFSFNGNKSLTTGAGGLLSTNNKTIFVRAEKLSQNGKNINKNYTYDIIGHNYKMSNLHASIGISQIKKFGEIKLKKCHSILKCLQL